MYKNNSQLILTGFQSVCVCVCVFLRHCGMLIHSQALFFIT